MNNKNASTEPEGNAINKVLTAGLSPKRIPWNKGKKKPVADEDGFLQVKEAQPSVFENYIHQSVYTNHGQRVVSGQRVSSQSLTILINSKISYPKLEG